MPSAYQQQAAARCEGISFIASSSEANSAFESRALHPQGSPAVNKNCCIFVNIVDLVQKLCYC